VTLVEQHDERALTDCLSVYAPQADDGSRREFAGLLLASRELESRTIPVAQIPIPDCRVTESTVLIRNNEHDFALVGRPRVSESFLDQRRRVRRLRRPARSYSTLSPTSRQSWPSSLFSSSLGGSACSFMATGSDFARSLLTQVRSVAG
jgi:hypothetical protein